MCEAEVKAAGAPELSIAPAPCVCAPQPQYLLLQLASSLEYTLLVICILDTR